MTREGVRSRVYSPARRLDGSRPRNRVQRTFLSGESDDARDGTPAQTRPHVHVSPHRAIGAHTDAYTCLRSRLAAVAPFMDAAVTATIVDAVPAVSAAAPPPPMASPMPLGCIRVAASVCPIRDAGSDCRHWVCFGMGYSLGGVCSGCPYGAAGSPRSASERVGTGLRAVLGDPWCCHAGGNLKPLK